MICTSSYAMIFKRIYYPTKIKGLELKSEYENTTKKLNPQNRIKEKTKRSKQRIKDFVSVLKTI